MTRSVVGWVGAYDGVYQESQLSVDRKKALVERIRKRQYNFTHYNHQFMPYAAPLYDDGCYCVLTKQEWDSVMGEAYGDMPFPERLMPQDIIEERPINGVLYEKKKFYEQMKSEGRVK